MRFYNVLLRLPVALSLLASFANVHAGGDTSLATELFVTGLHRPVVITAPRTDQERIFVVEKDMGRIRIVKNGVLLPDPFLDLGAQISVGGEEGLLGLAFDPNYSTNGRFFVFYNDLSGDTRLEAYNATPPGSDVANPAPLGTLLTIGQPFIHHNAGTLAFGPNDGMLYLSTGDGGAGNDPLGNGQSIQTLLGKILRIDVSSLPYSIPPDNPFVGVSGAAEEIWVYGLRNPWRYAFDTNGDMYIGDVGQESLEEINFLPASSVGGENFGWSCMEGTEPGPDTCESMPLDPIHEYSHNVGCSVTGGHVYRGASLPDLQGTYFFGDYCTGKVWSFRYDGNQVADFKDRTTELDPPGGSLGLISCFGEDAKRNLYIGSYFTGEIYRIVEGAVIPDCDDDGVSDAEELALGTEFDLNANDVPDSCELLLASDDLFKGLPATIQMIGVEPGLPVAYFYTLRGIGTGPCFLPDLCLDLSPMNIGGQPTVPLLDVSFAQAQGQAELTVIVPQANIPNVAFQAVVIDGLDSVKSNPIQKTIGG